MESCCLNRVLYILPIILIECFRVLITVLRYCQELHGSIRLCSGLGPVCVCVLGHLSGGSPFMSRVVAHLCREHVGWSGPVCVGVLGQLSGGSSFILRVVAHLCWEHVALSVKYPSGQTSYELSFPKICFSLKSLILTGQTHELTMNSPSNSLPCTFKYLSGQTRLLAMNSSFNSVFPFFPKVKLVN